MSPISPRMVILGGLIFTSLTGSVTAQADEAEETLRPALAGIDCGLASLYLLLRLKGYHSDLSSLLAQLPPRAAAGYSMMELRDTAGHLGLRLFGVRLESNGPPPGTPILAFLNRDGHGHFLVIRPVGHTGKMVQVFDGLPGPVVIDWLDVCKSPEWTGLALVPRARGWSPIIAPAGALIGGLALTIFHFRRRWSQSVDRVA